MSMEGNRASGNRWWGRWWGRRWGKWDWVVVPTDRALVLAAVGLLPAAISVWGWPAGLPLPPGVLHPGTGWLRWGWYVLILLIYAVDAAFALRTSFQARRQLPPRLGRGNTATIRLEVVRERGSCRRLELVDAYPAGWEVSPPSVFPVELRSPSPASSRRNLPFPAFSRRLGDANQGGPAANSSSTTVTATYQVIPPHRGEHRFGPLYLRWTGPLRLARRQVALDALATTVPVYPDLASLSRVNLIGWQRRVAGEARYAHPWSQPAFFHGLREYLPGDAYRHINWKATARRDFPVVNEYELPRRRRVLIVLEAGRTASLNRYGRPRLEMDVDAALALAATALLVGDEVGFIAFAERPLHVLAPSSGEKQLGALLQALAHLTPVPAESNYRLLTTWVDNTSGYRDAELVMVFGQPAAGGAAVEQEAFFRSLLDRGQRPALLFHRDPRLEEAATAWPSNLLVGYEKAAALEEVARQRLVQERLRRLGVLLYESVGRDTAQAAQGLPDRQPVDSPSPPRPVSTPPRSATTDEVITIYARMRGDETRAQTRRGQQAVQ